MEGRTDPDGYLSLPSVDPQVFTVYLDDDFFDAPTPPRGSSELRPVGKRPTTVARTVYEFVKRPRRVYFRSGFSKTDWYYKPTAKAIAQWEERLWAKGYETRTKLEATARDLVTGLEDPTTVAVIWTAHGGSAGRLYASDGGFYATSAGIWRDEVTNVQSVLNSYVDANGVNVVELGDSEVLVPVPVPLKTVSRRLRFAVLYGCKVAAPSESWAKLAERVPPNEIARYIFKMVGGMEGKADWERLLGVPVYANPTLTFGTGDIDPNSSPAPGPHTWDNQTTWDWNDIDLEDRGTVSSGLLDNLPDRLASPPGAGP